MRIHNTNLDFMSALRRFKIVPKRPFREYNSLELFEIYRDIAGVKIGTLEELNKHLTGFMETLDELYLQSTGDGPVNDPVTREIIRVNLCNSTLEKLKNISISEDLHAPAWAATWSWLIDTHGEHKVSINFK